ncbi:hypothetical protein Taro_037621 [Colocasia esculenta]|uniref:Uncharacterized protein n=1 Tax=Colocasia esculenta TaxID=4460 RepID=A0A843WQ82_COLES|nr:hypothetical protein [Colocasia esculenta]
MGAGDDYPECDLTIHYVIRHNVTSSSFKMHMVHKQFQSMIYMFITENYKVEESSHTTENVGPMVDRTTTQLRHQSHS